MKTKSIAFNLACLLLFTVFAVPAIATSSSCDPPCGTCYECIGGSCVWVGCNPPCGDCYVCAGCSCIYLCNSDDCEICEGGWCEDICPSYHSCLKCDGCGGCVTKCHPELCEECVNNECKVCGGDTNQKCCGGVCKEKCELYPTGDCETSQSHECKGCFQGGESTQCSDYKKKVYTGNDVKICYKPGCPGDCVNDDEVHCYTEYTCINGMTMQSHQCYQSFGFGEYECHLCNTLLNPGCTMFVCFTCMTDPDDEGTPHMVPSKKCAG